MSKVTCSCLVFSVNDEPVGTGSGNSKLAAKGQAAEEALSYLVNKHGE